MTTRAVQLLFLQWCVDITVRTLDVVDSLSIAIGPLSWAYPVEIFNAATRAKATAVTSSAAWISNFMIAQVSPPAFSNVGWLYVPDINILLRRLKQYDAASTWSLRYAALAMP